ncbi:MAG: ferrous iron transporter B [Clostridia bacterium]|nr:ferrous iron transporter B [Clostridia bacterium]
MDIKIALAGNPNCGKTTLFNALTGSNQFVGNWPGVTVEKKEGRLKKHDNVLIADLPGIYSLSPYTLEEVVARNYLITERPDAILNIVDGTNLERNLYLTTQLTELGIPVVIAINMMDVVEKNGDKINIQGLSKVLGCRIVEISALKGTGIMEAAEAAVAAATSERTVPTHSFAGTVEHALAHIEEACVHGMPQEQQRWYSIKIFERDEKVLETLKLSEETLAHIEEDIRAVEAEYDDDAESIITNERYVYIAQILKGIYKKRSAGKDTLSDKIDKVVTNRWAALPIFAVIMFIVYFISVTTVGTFVTDFTNDGLFGDGFFFLGIGESKYEEAVDAYVEENNVMEEAAVIIAANEAAGLDIKGIDDLKGALGSLYNDYLPEGEKTEDEPDFGAFEEAVASYGAQVAAGEATLDAWLEEKMADAPAPSDGFGAWCHGIPVLFDMMLESWAPDWFHSLVVDGIIAGVGAVLGFVPQILVLFILLAILESCGYMARVAFVMDRIFRKFGLSGKSFIPMLIGTGCGVPGIMASRTIENERDRRMTIMTTTFIPCGAKLPIIALIAGALFDGGWWVAPVAYFIGIAAVIVSGIILKKTKRFAGEPAPFVMELPAYHLPTVSNVLRSMWERGWSFIKKAGTIILLSSLLIWAGSCFGYVDGAYVFDLEMELENSVLGGFGTAIGWIFAPLGFAQIETAIATVMGLVAKEEVVAVFGVLDFLNLGKLAGFSFMVFNLLCAPCFAAIGAMRREMNNAKWTWFAIGYQCGFAYAVSFCIYQIGVLFTPERTGWNIFGAVIAAAIIAFAVYMMVRPAKVEVKEKIAEHKTANV